MATTAGGFPYPVGTDMVRDGDNAIKALADAIEGRLGTNEIQRGAGSGTTDAGGLINVNWPHAFAAGARPWFGVVLFEAGGRPVTYRRASVPNTGGVVLALYVNGSTLLANAAYEVDWIAIGPKA